MIDESIASAQTRAGNWHPTELEQYSPGMLEIARNREPDAIQHLEQFTALVSYMLGEGSPARWIWRDDADRLKFAHIFDKVKAGWPYCGHCCRIW